MPIIRAAMLMTNSGSSSWGERSLTITPPPPARAEPVEPRGPAHPSTSSGRAENQWATQHPSRRARLLLAALLAQPLEQLALAGRERLRQQDAHTDHKVASGLVLRRPAVGPELRHAQAGEAEDATVLGERRNLEGDVLAGERLDPHPAP